MIDVQDILIRGSKKVIDHYRLLLARAQTDGERELYRNRIEREERLLHQLQNGFPDRRAA